MNRQYGALSGVAILLIVLNHAIHFGLQVSPVEGGWLRLLILLQALGGFAVPVFLFISGAFLSYAAAELTFAFVKGNVGRIVWPYVIWSLIFYAALFLIAGERYSVAGYVKNLLVGYPYHFIPLLVFWYVLAPLLVRIGRRHGVALLVIIGLYQVVLLALRFPGAWGLAGWLPAWTAILKPPVLFSSMSNWAIYVPLGLVLSMHDRTIRPYLVRLRWVSAAAVAAVFVAGILNAFDLMVAPWARYVAPVPLMFLLPTVDRGAILLLRQLEFVGKRSYGIYLAHFVVINLAVFVAARASGPLLHPVMVYPTFYVVALGVSLVLMEVMARAAGTRKLYRYVFGIVPPAADVRRRQPHRSVPHRATPNRSGSTLPTD